MQNFAELNKSTHEPWWHTLLGCLYFLLAGVGLMVQEMPIAWFESARLFPVDWTYIVCLLIPAIGFAAGWASGFPRWSYPYTGGLLVWSLYLMGNSSPLLWGLGSPIQVSGWRAWIPFLLACAVGFALSQLLKRSAAQSRGNDQPPHPSAQRTSAFPSPINWERGRGEGASLPPERSAAQSQGFFFQIAREPSLASYLMFGWMPLLLFIAFDEVNRLFTLVFVLTLTVVMIATSLLYQRLSRAESRTRALTVGVIACVLLLEIAVIGYWLPRNGVFVPGALAWGVVIPAVMLYPIYAAHLLKRAQGAKEA